MFDQQEFNEFFESDPEWMRLINHSFIIRSIYHNAKANSWSLIKFLSFSVKFLEEQREQSLRRDLEAQLLKPIHEFSFNLPAGMLAPETGTIEQERVIQEAFLKQCDRRTGQSRTKPPRDMIDELDLSSKNSNQS